MSATTSNRQQHFCEILIWPKSDRTVPNSCRRRIIINAEISPWKGRQCKSENNKFTFLSFNRIQPIQKITTRTGSRKLQEPLKLKQTLVFQHLENLLFIPAIPDLTNHSFYRRPCRALKIPRIILGGHVGCWKYQRWNSPYYNFRFGQNMDHEEESKAQRFAMFLCFCNFFLEGWAGMIFCGLLPPF